MKRKWWIPLSIALFSTMSLNAAAYGKNNHPPKPPPMEHDGPSVAGAMTPDNLPKGVTADAGPRITPGVTVFLSGDFIYWTGRMDGLGYAYTGYGNPNNVPLMNVSKGSVKHPDWSWDPGFKVALGLGLPHDGWDLSAEYTWYQTSGSDSTTSSSMDVLWNIADFLRQPGSGDIVSAKGSWDLHFNAIDLELGRNYFISPYLKLRPHVGFKGTWQDIDYSAEARYFPEQGIDNLLKMKNDQDYWGIGIRAGLDTAWQFDNNWSIYGDFALSALWSRYDVDRKDTMNQLDNLAPDAILNTPFNIIHTENDFHTIKGVLEFGIGMRGEWWFSCERFHILLQAGWEEQIWINHNNLLHIEFNEANHGDMILQGLTMKLRLDF